jgi:hypothetical protein
MDTSSPQTKVERNQQSMNEGEKSALIDRIAASNHFRRSSRLKDMLLFLGSRAADDSQAEVHEQEIGEKVFGRPAEYDRGQDNIVRVNASELRKRLELYFSHEGKHEDILVSMPRGGYRLVFHHRSSAKKAAGTQASAAPPDSDAQPSEAEPQASRPGAGRWAWLWALIGLCTGIAATLLAVHLLPGAAGASAAARQPLVSAFWLEFSPRSGDIDLVLSDASVNITEYILGRPISLTDYTNKDYFDAAEQAHASADRLQDIHQIFHHDIVALGDFEAAEQILSLPTIHPKIRLVPPRVYSPDSLAQNSLILIGGEPANPWVGLFNASLNFSLDDNDPGMLLYVLNRHPRPGEQRTYNPSTQNSVITGYGVLAYLPSPNHVGNILILAGTDAQTTKAVAEYVTSERKLSELQKKLGASETRHIPYFEAVIKSSRISDTSFSSKIVAYRTNLGPDAKSD